MKQMNDPTKKSTNELMNKLTNAMLCKTDLAFHSFGETFEDSRKLHFSNINRVNI